MTRPERRTREIRDLRGLAACRARTIGKHRRCLRRDASAGEGSERHHGAIATFPGLAHRIEQVGAIAHVRFVNDSKATNADAAAKALACYDNIYWIAGGKAKEVASTVSHHSSRAFAKPI